MVTTVKQHYFWKKMIFDIVDFIAKYMECQQIKNEQQHPTGIVQPLPIPDWKWEVINMDFITGLPKIRRQNYSIMVVVDKLLKLAHFIPVKSNFKVVNIAEIFLREILKLHGVPKEIICDRDSKFTSKLWRTLFAGLDTQLIFNTT